MTETRITTRQVKLAVIDKVIYLLERVGCTVQRAGIGDRINLQIIIPPDSKDPHGERLEIAKSA